MGRLALTAVVLAGLVVSAEAAAVTPRWTAKGAVSRLNARSITVNGKSCRITPASPGRATLRIFFVGTRVKIECADGVLLDIDVLHQLPPVNVAPIPTTPPSTSSNVTLLITQTQSSVNGATVSSTTVAGNFSITALGNGSISAGSGSQTVTCQVGGGSPDVSDYHVGDRLSRLECRNGVLTTLTRA